MTTVQVALWVVVALVALAIAFDFMNGFHDAANSIATVVSTGVLKPGHAVVFAAFFNLIAIFVFHLSVAATVGKGTEKRTADGNEDAGDGGAVAPQGLALGSVADDDVGEIGREEEGQDQRVERLHRPVEEHPRDARRQRSAHHGRGLSRRSHFHDFDPQRRAPQRLPYSTEKGGGL